MQSHLKILSLKVAWDLIDILWLLYRKWVEEGQKESKRMNLDVIVVVQARDYVHLY